MIYNEIDRQAFEIWYNGGPKLTFDDARKACGGGSHRVLAEKIFFSDGWEFQRWLITSGFQEFVETQSVSGRWEGDNESPREMALEVLEDLWNWMKYNEKQMNTDD